MVVSLLQCGVEGRVGSSVWGSREAVGYGRWNKREGEVGGEGRRDGVQKRV